MCAHAIFQQPKDTTRLDETMYVRLLLPELCKVNSLLFRMQNMHKTDVRPTKLFLQTFLKRLKLFTRLRYYVSYFSILVSEIRKVAPKLRPGPIA